MQSLIVYDNYELTNCITLHFAAVNLQSDCIPLEWKQCKVTTVHKAGPQNDPSNYCPISVVSIITKTVEKIVASQLDRYPKTNQHL